MQLKSRLKYSPGKHDSCSGRPTGVIAGNYAWVTEISGALPLPICVVSPVPRRQKFGGTCLCQLNGNGAYACDLFVNFGNLRLRTGEAMTFNIYTQINNVMFLAEVRVTGEVEAQNCCNGDVTFLWEIFSFFSFFSEQCTEQTSGHTSYLDVKS